MTNDALSILAQERTVRTAEGFLARHRNDGLYSARKVPLHHVVLKQVSKDDIINRLKLSSNNF
jgi:hypothetical protein